MLFTISPPVLPSYTQGGIHLIHHIEYCCCNYPGLLTTFGGSQEVFAAGLAACGSQARSKNRREPPEVARNQAPE